MLGTQKSAHYATRLRDFQIFGVKNEKILCLLLIGVRQQLVCGQKKKWFGNPGHAALPFKTSIDASISLTDLKAKTASLLDFSALCPIF